MADYRYCTGRFSRLTTTGFQTITGIEDALGSFTPKGIIIFGTIEVGNTNDNFGRFFLGMTDLTRELCFSTFLNAGQTYPDIDWTRCQTNTNLISINNETQTGTSYAAVLDGVDDGEFTLEWTSTANSDAFDLNYIVFGGTDLSVCVGSDNDKTSTGTQTTTLPTSIGQITGLLTFSVPGIGFNNYAQPVVLNTSLPNFGFTDGTDQGVFSLYTTTQSDSAVLIQNTRLLQRMEYFKTVVTWASLTSLGVDEFTVNYGVTAGLGPFTGGAGFFYFAIAGPTVKMGSSTSPTSAGNTSISLAFNPGAALIVSGGKAASTTPSDNARMGFGVLDRTTQYGNWWGALDGVTSVRDRMQSDGEMIIMADPVDPSGVDTIALGSAVLTEDSIDITWSEADASAREFIYIAFEGSDAPPNGTIVVGKVTYPYSPDTEFDFEAGAPLSPDEFTLKDGETRIFSVEPGTYSIIEVVNANFFPTYMISNDPDGDNEAIVVGSGEVIDVVILNTFATRGGGIYSYPLPGYPGSGNPPLFPGAAKSDDDFVEQDGSISVLKISDPYIVTGFVGDK